MFSRLPRDVTFNNNIRPACLPVGLQERQILGQQGLVRQDFSSNSLNKLVCTKIYFSGFGKVGFGTADAQVLQYYYSEIADIFGCKLE